MTLAEFISARYMIPIMAPVGHPKRGYVSLATQPDSFGPIPFCADQIVDPQQFIRAIESLPIPGYLIFAAPIGNWMVAINDRDELVKALKAAFPAQ